MDGRHPESVRRFEEVLVEQCAPTLAGLKPASMFRYQPRDLKAEPLKTALRKLPALEKLLKARGVEVFVLKHCPRTETLLFFVYREKRLKELLSREEHRVFLAESGFCPEDGTEALLHRFSERICCSEHFPHEIGLLLGYPLPDVIGFIENAGRNSRETCCWKSYSDPEKARRCMKLYRHCTAVYRERFADGMPLSRLVVAA